VERPSTNAASRELAGRWLQKATNDLITARQTLLLPEGPTDTVAFHAQQAVENALKALLTFNQFEFPKIHDLVRLMDIARTFLPSLEEYRAAFAEISNYSIQVRYPDESLGPDREDATRSTAIAEEVVDRVRRSLSETSQS
jgi:HEPN domain-containing protein